MFINLMKVIFGIMIALLLIIAGVVVNESIQNAKAEKIARAEIIKSYNIGDVETFLDRINMGLCDFVKSESLRSEYERYKKGEIELAAKPKKHTDNSSVSLATGLALGMAMSAGRR